METHRDQSPTDLYCRLREKDVRVTMQQAQILHLLWSGRVVSYSAFEDALYGDDPTGGPDSDIRNIVSVHINQLRHLGFNIVTHHGVGYQLRNDE